MYPNYYGCPYKQKSPNQAANGYIPAEEPNDKTRQHHIQSGMTPGGMAPGGMAPGGVAPGGTTTGGPTTIGGAPSSFEMAPGSPVLQDTQYTQGFLRTQIGKRVLVSFLIGTNTYQDRTGILEDVGISYIILREPGNTRLLCDIYSIKFVRIYPTTQET